MPTLTHLTDFQGTILDALADYAENFENAAEASEGNAAQYFDERAIQAELIYDKVRAGIDLSANDLALVDAALVHAENNCRELDLNEAADEYERASILVQELI